MKRSLPMMSATVVLALHTGCGSCNSRDVPVDLLSEVPASAKIVMVMNVASMADDVRAMTPYADYAGRWEDLGDELDDYLADQLGVGLLGAERVVVWSDGEEDWCGYIEGDFDGELRGDTEELEGHRAMELDGGAWLVVHEGAVLVGTRGGLSETLAVVAGGAESLDDSDSDRAESLRDLLDTVGAEGLAVAMYGGLDDVLDEMGPLPVGRPVAVALGSTAEQLTVRVRFDDDATAESTVQQLQMLRGVALQTLRTAADDARDGDVPEAFEAIVSKHLAELFLEELLTLDTDGSDVVVEVELGGLGVGAVGLVGVMASVAIPAYLKYISRSKTAEAVANLRRLSLGASAYYEAEHVDAMGQLTPLQFPASTPRTPAQVPCGEQAPPQAQDWQGETWQALYFEMADPHYYSYQFDSTGSAEWATFTASAFGDLDCDGNLSTFVREGYISNGEVDESGPYIYDELE